MDVFDFSIGRRPRNTIGITDNLGWHPAFEPQKPDEYKRCLHIKEIYTQISTSYSKAVHRLIRWSNKQATTKYCSFSSYAISKENVRGHVTKYFKEGAFMTAGPSNSRH